jgi:glycosyltransferase involved in cell wall biosynthesis
MGIENKKSSPLISICIPTYNGVQYLEECISSIRAQTFEDFEVLICDDQSTDGTLVCAEKFADGDPRFRFVANPQRFGLVGNWNNCIQQAKGEWIKFLFQDDLITPSCIEELIDACRNNGKKFAFCARGFLFEAGVTSAARSYFWAHKNQLHGDYLDAVVISPELASGIMRRNCYHNPVGEPTVTLIHRTVFNEVGLFDKGLIQLCDTEMWYRIMLRFGGVFLQQELALFRIHSNATTALNHRKRAFRANTLDPLAIQYRIAFGHHFKLMRHSQKKITNAMVRMRKCALSSHMAKSEAKLQEQVGDGSLMLEWREFKLFCPGINILARISPLLELPGRIERKLLRNFKNR